MVNAKRMTEEEKKEALEKALARIKPVVRANIDKGGNDNSVLGRLGKIANANTKEEPEKTKPKDKKPIGLDEIAKKGNEIDKKAKEHGIDPASARNKKDEKEKNKDKEKDEKEKDPVKKQEAKMKEMFSKVKLPSGMEIHQEGPSWVLISKDGKQRTDITDVMNTIDKYNRNVDAANEENRMQNQAQSGVDKAVDVNKKDEGLNVNETSGKVQIVGEALPRVKDVDGNPVFKEEDIKKVAETAISISNEKALLGKLKDPKALEEMEKRNKRNEENARIAQQKAMESRQASI